MLADGVSDRRPGDEDPGAVALLHKLAHADRRRPPSLPAGRLSLRRSHRRAQARGP
jgi:hypothetical protein